MSAWVCVHACASTLFMHITERTATLYDETNTAKQACESKIAQHFWTIYSVIHIYLSMLLTSIQSH
jgi:hypothetical protein